MSERKLAPRTHEVYEGIYRLNIKKHLAHLALGEIKPATIRTWRTTLLKEGRSEIQAVKVYRILRAVFNTAIKEDELLKVNPCRIKGFDKERAPERPVPTVRQAHALAEEMLARFHALILLAAYSGLRWGVLTALRGPTSTSRRPPYVCTGSWLWCGESRCSALRSLKPASGP